MLLPVILAQPESPSFYVLWFVVPAGNLLLSLPVLNLQLKTYNFPVKGLNPPNFPVLWFVIPKRSGGICFCFCCHSERSEESPYLLLLLPVILSFAQNLRRCLFFCLSFPQGICFCFGPSF